MYEIKAQGDRIVEVTQGHGTTYYQRAGYDTCAIPKPCNGRMDEFTSKTDSFKVTHQESAEESD